jgi:osmotically-inducible protein OsmY
LHWAPELDETDVATKVTDPEIARNVVAAIRAAIPRSHENVKPVVQNGHATLEGMLNWELSAA